MRKNSKQPISKIQRDIWQECRRIAFKNYKNDCYTCGTKDLQGANCQLGHMWAKASVGAYLKYDMRILRWQCMRCNQFMGGMGADYYSRMIKEIGEEKMRELEIDRNKTVKAYDFYVELLQKYKEIV